MAIYMYIQLQCVARCGIYLLSSYYCNHNVANYALHYKAASNSQNLPVSAHTYYSYVIINKINGTPLRPCRIQLTDA